MRLFLPSRFLLLRHQGSIPFARHALAEFASSSDANRRLFSSFGAAWLPLAVQQKRSSPGANRITPVCEAGGHLLLKSSCNQALEFLRTFRDEYRGQRPPDVPVIVSSQVWQLLGEYDMPAKIKSVYRVHIETTQTTSKQVQLVLRGRKAREVATQLADPPLKMDVPEEVGLWLITEGTNGLRLKDILKRSGALVRPSRDNKSVLLVGPSKATLEAKRIIDGLHVQHDRIPRAAYCWLINKTEGSEYARQVGLERKFDTCVHMGKPSDDDPACMVDLVVVGERQENVTQVFAVLDGLHVQHGRISRAVNCWLTNKAEGSEYAREMDLERKFDTCVYLGKPSDDDPTCMVDLAVIGKREANVAQVLAVIDSIVVEKVNMTELQQEFWMGHEDEENRNRPHHRLEDATDTCFVRDDAEGCMHVAGRPDCIREAVEEINKTQHIALRTSAISFAMSTYIVRWARRVPGIENDERQIHLSEKDMQPGSWELRRMYVVTCQSDDAEAGKAEDDLMRELDLDEIVLEVPAWAQFLFRQCREMEKDTATGISFSTGDINGRVIVAIAGTRSTVKQGMKEVIRRIEGHASYNEGDICLRRIEGESVDADGFKKIGDAKPLNLSSCKEPFSWERLTRERWSYAGAPRGGRPPKRPRQPSV